MSWDLSLSKFFKIKKKKITSQYEVLCIRIFHPHILTYILQTHTYMHTHSSIYTNSRGCSIYLKIHPATNISKPDKKAQMSPNHQRLNITTWILCNNNQQEFINSCCIFRLVFLNCNLEHLQLNYFIKLLCVLTKFALTCKLIK